MGLVGNGALTVPPGKTTKQKTGNDEGVVPYITRHLFLGKGKNCPQTCWGISAGRTSKKKEE